MKCQLIISLICFASNYTVAMNNPSQEKQTIARTSSLKKIKKTKVSTRPFASYKKNYECSRSDCKKIFTQKNLLKEHTLKGHDVSKKEIAQYMMIESKKNPLGKLICPDCHKSFSGSARDGLVSHVRKQHNIDPFYCMHNECLQSFSSHNGLSTHMQTAHGQNKKIRSQSTKQRKQCNNVIYSVMYNNSVEPPKIVSPKEVVMPAVIADNTDLVNDIHSIDDTDLVMKDLTPPPLRISDYDQNMISDIELALSPIDYTTIDLKNWHPDTPKRIWLPDPRCSSTCSHLHHPQIIN